MTQSGNFYFVGNLLLQKFSSPAFSAVTRIDFRPTAVGDKSGLVVMGQEWGYLALYKTSAGVRIGAFKGRYEQYDDVTEELASVPAQPSSVDLYSYHLKVTVEQGGSYRFSFSLDGIDFEPIGDSLQAKAGVWIGAKVGLFSLNPGINKSDGYADFDWFRMN